jgi:hypothetical protein
MSMEYGFRNKYESPDTNTRTYGQRLMNDHLDCRVCDNYMASSYMPSCGSTTKCEGGNLWTRTKIVQVWT